MTGKILTSKTYQSLLSDLKGIIEAGSKKAENFVRSQLVLVYWEVGKRIIKEDLTNNANYYSLILEDLSNDLGIDKTTLGRSAQFFNSYPNKPQISNLGWSHYKQLIAVKDNDLRLKLEQKTKEENWSVLKLTSVIEQIKENKTPALPSNKTIKRPTDPNYLYKATIANIIDGDTLLLNINLGFQTIRKQRVRLSQIDAPEMKTKQGKESFNFLRDKLALIKEVVVKTNKIDIYGRYLGDIFYYKNQDQTNRTTQAQIFKEGTHLNQELLEKGLATIL